MLKYGTNSKNQRQVFVECSFVSEVKMQSIIDECNAMADKSSEKKLTQPLDPERYGVIGRKDMDCIFEDFDGELSTTED